MSRTQQQCAAVEAWFKANGRAFPWRTDRTPWRALVSECMLQQTQASRVAERFENVMREFPTPAHLAGAPLDALLAHWQGLGYYSRARNLHRAAQHIVEQFNGQTPVDAGDLLALPGVGRYTSGAIASIVGGRREPIVDGNVRRVLARLHGDDAPSGDRGLEQRSWDRATDWVGAATSPALANEGLMELGAVICTPRQAGCEACPLANSCTARAKGRVDQCPAPRLTRPRPTEHVHALLLRRRGSVLLNRGGESGRFAGTWTPPLTVTDTSDGDPALWRDLPTGDHQVLGTFEHVLTHRRLLVHVSAADARSGSRLAGRHARWVDPARPAVPVSTLVKKMLAQAVSDTASGSDSG